MRIMIFGGRGQVGRELGRADWPTGCEPMLLGRADCDLTDTVTVRRTVLQARPEIVINAAAYTAVDRAEAEPEIAGKINRDAPAAMAEACEEMAAALIHLSTDYVFDGSKRGAYVEDDPVAPLSVYGRTKAEGEAEVGRAARRHVILRTSWVFASHGNNFVRTMLRLADERPELRIICDQRGAPTAARDIASAIVSIVASVGDGGKSWGIFHFTSAESASWHDFARAILEGAGRQTKLVPISTAEYKTAAQRPSNSVLDCGRIAREYGVRQPSWRRALADILTDLQQTANMTKIATA